ncbi:hypothetical protein GCM10009850_022400 [Nonomuraea monospora]|uniref:Protein kinase domain-containing protein n=1 Tax=Nonomuraea monospora TaxID=568818 RepID=A0ABP5P4U1_9ACTN
MTGVPPINFRAHALRQNDAGGRDEFEQMLGLLVHAITGLQTRIPEARGGDWGIDALVGDLNGRVSIWQAKYYMDGFTTQHRSEVNKSFQSALNAAGDHGHTIDRWTLCIPRNMPPASVKWWHDWSARQQAATGIVIDLWDDNELRSLLARPEADHIRHLYYDPYRPATEAPELPVASALLNEDEAWRAGAVAAGYLLHEDAREILAADRSWAWREATADRIQPPGLHVMLRQVRIFRDSVAGSARRDGLIAQAALLDELRNARGLPRKAEMRRDGDGSMTLATTRPDGPLWRDVFGPVPSTPPSSPAISPLGSSAPLDRLSTAAVVATAAVLCDTLHELHRRGHAHRALSPDTVVLRGGRHQGVPRDLGLTALPPVPGEGHAPYQAPEQHRPALAALPPGPRTDVYQVASLIHHTVSGLPGAALPLRAVLPEIPPRLEEALARALDPDPRRRPGDIRALGAELRNVRGELSGGGRR